MARGDCNLAIALGGGADGGSVRTSMRFRQKECTDVFGRGQAGQGERGVKGAQHKTASVEALGHGGKVVWIARHRNRYGPRPAHAIKLPEECALSLHFEYNRRAGLILNRSRPFDRELPFSFLRPRRGPEPRLPSTGARRKLPPRAP